MKKLVLTLCIGMSYSFMQAQGQNLPYIGTTTIIPQNPGPNDNIKIVTHVTTPNQGILVDRSHNVNHAVKEINIRGCYTNGMAPATQTYIDTFSVGQLAAGVYTIRQKAYISTSQLVCVKTADSNMVVLTLTVSGLNTGIKKNSKSTIEIFPNPVKDFLRIKNTSAYLNVQIYSYKGDLIRNEELGLNSEINVSDLSAGLYFIRFENELRVESYKFIKEN